jgi:3-(3-hydroxy-phenyl)propionate hydroxylase
VETPDGIYTVEADWLIAADGARSPIRRMLGWKSKARSSWTASSSPTW